MKLYLAGPVFTLGERMFNAALAKGLRERGHEVWLPQEKEVSNDHDATFKLCIEGIDWCDVVLANMDGPDPDSGTCGECGYAYRKRAIVAYRTDFRFGGESRDPHYNLMLSHFANYNHDVSLSECLPKDSGEHMLFVIGYLCNYLDEPGGCLLAKRAT